MRRLYLVLLFSLLITACTSGSQDFPIGVYVDQNGGVTEFKADGTYDVRDSEDQDPIIFGDYVIEGDTLTIRDNLFYCPDYVGVYRWSVEEDQSLALEVIDEECVGRGRVLSEGLTYLHP